MKHLSGNGKQQVIADGNPYLRVYTAFWLVP